MKIAFIVGHHRRGKGAYSPYFNKTEFDFYKDLELDLMDLGDVFYHNPLIFGYNRRQKEIANRTKDYDLVFELHFNASADGDAEGCEAWYYHKNDYTKAISRRFCNSYSSFVKGTNRGAKEFYSRNQRGFGFAYYQKTNAILLEPFFGDNSRDCLRFDIKTFIKSIKYAIS